MNSLSPTEVSTSKYSLLKYAKSEQLWEYLLHTAKPVPKYIPMEDPGQKLYYQNIPSMAKSPNEAFGFDPAMPKNSIARNQKKSCLQSGLLT